MSDRIEQVLELVSEMPAMELSELSQRMQDKFGVVPMAAAAAAAPAVETAAAAEQTEFDVMLVSAENKVGAIKAIRSLEGNTLGLKEAKELVEKAPVAVKTAVAKEEAESIKAKLEEAGCKVEVK